MRLSTSPSSNLKSLSPSNSRRYTQQNSFSIKSLVSDTGILILSTEIRYNSDIEIVRPISSEVSRIAASIGVSFISICPAAEISNKLGKVLLSAARFCSNISIAPVVSRLQIHMCAAPCSTASSRCVVVLRPLIGSPYSL